MNTKFLVLVATFLASVGALAAPSSESAVTSQVPKVEKEFDKKILRGDVEISPEFSLGYSSFSGVFLNSNLAYRYFFFDKIALGGSVGFDSSDDSKGYRLGVSGRWYFAELGNWAFSFTQEFLTSHYRYKGPNYEHSRSFYTSVSSIGAHYFLTPNVALGLNLNYISPLTSDDNPSLISRVGLNFNF